MEIQCLLQRQVTLPHTWWMTRASESEEFVAWTESVIDFAETRYMEENVAHRAIAYFVTYLSTCPPDVTWDSLMWQRVASVWLAMKATRDFNSPASKFLESTRAIHTVTREHVQSLVCAEREVCSATGFQLHHPTPVDFVHAICDNIGSDASTRDRYVQALRHTAYGTPVFLPPVHRAAIAICRVDPRMAKLLGSRIN